MKYSKNLLASGALVGQKVINQASEHIGKIEELMISVADGRIAYAVLSFGGFLHFGNKFFAIPWSTFYLDEGRDAIVLDIDKETLENAPGFDKSNWPDRIDEAFMTEVDTFYKFKPEQKAKTREEEILK